VSWFSGTKSLAASIGYFGFDARISDTRSMRILSLFVPSIAGTSFGSRCSDTPLLKNHKHNMGEIKVAGWKRVVAPFKMCDTKKWQKLIKAG
jgi:hypothetical protein